ncbi:AAA family ATPase [Arthrobacter sp. lap29]|uniref:ATP-dependent DNA helicase n=1 Tax=Arthrobacter sp. lap29 TaxID=3056122 RepID=UPI0028F6E574|nr:AAA family ATPase [Arthrobacter sp. lap29]
MDTSKNDAGPSIAPDLADTLLITNSAHPGSPVLAEDQAAAAHEVLCSGRFLDAVVGPAGSGKTTTMAAIRQGWEKVHGAGSVIGLAPAAASADVLGRKMGLAAENVSKWLYESVGQGAAIRAEQFHDLEGAAAPLSWQRTRSAQRMAGLAMRQQQWCFRPNQLVIIDEASMVSTAQLAALVHQAQDAGAKIALVGDPAQLDSIDAGGILGWLDRKGQTVQLTSIRRFNHLWEGPASLLLRAGDVESIQSYAAHGRLRHGDHPDMIDQAYESWAADTSNGLESILIAPDNDAVTALNERAHAELVDRRVVDATHVVRLSDGLSAGRGDTVNARKNDRRIKDDAGDFIRNGTLIKISSKPSRDGAIHGRRLDTGQRIRLSCEYLAESVELGYATTAHRSQGITVDTSHTVLTQGCLTRELFYVGMTRGRDCNTAYVCESDIAQDHVALDAAEPTWQEIIAEVLAAQGAERTAHEVGEEERESSNSLHQLAAEYDYLAQIVAADQLRAAVERTQPGLAASLEVSPSWGAGVAAWRSAVAAEPLAAAATLDHAIRRPGDTKDLMAVIHARLRQIGNAKNSDGDEWLIEDLHTNRADLAEMVKQVRHLGIRRVQELNAKAAAGTEPWTRKLADTIPSIISVADRNTLMERIAIYRDRWLIGTDPDPLGPPPADYEWERARNRERLNAELKRLQSMPANTDESSAAQVAVHATLTNVGWEI